MLGQFNGMLRLIEKKVIVNHVAVMDTNANVSSETFNAILFNFTTIKGNMFIATERKLFGIDSMFF